MAAAVDPGFVRFAKTDIEQSIPDRFARQVAAHRDRLAAKFGDASLTYDALDRLSNQVAQALLAERGPRAEPIGLLLPQGLELLAAILGVLKAGKFYLPLDPSHPAAYRDLIVAESGVECLISAETWPRLSSHSDGDPPALAIPPDALAYIYYTSGSTGRPKGVCDSHRNVLHNIMRYTNALRITHRDRLTLLQGPTFSGAVSSLFNALLNGAAVFPYDLKTAGLGRRLGEWLTREGITMYHSVPSVFRSFLLPDSRFPAIRTVRLEGDAASRLDVELFRRHFSPDAVLAIGLGATETGLVCQARLTPDTPLDEGLVPIGYATEDMECRVVDEAGREVESGAIGELAVRSDYLAIGYWRRPELTPTAFVPTGAAGAREYRTGDLARMRADGCFEYLGRRNARPKIRGHRVEPAEVESALLELSGIREAAVLIREADPDQGEVIAYLVSDTGADAETVRGRLAARIPEYMIPARFVFLGSLPLTENGKVDRAALPPPEAATAGEAQIPPDGPLEARLVELWEQILDRHPIGVTDDFFALGGSSMHGAEVLTALEEFGDHDLPPSVLIDAPTIRQLARLVRGEGVIRTSALVPLQPEGSRPPFFMVHAHTGQVRNFVHLSRALDPDQPFFALQSAGQWSRQPPPGSIEEMARQYLAEIVKVQPAGPYFLGGQCYGSMVALEMAHQLRDAGQRVALLFFVFGFPDDFPGLVPELVRRRFQLYARWDRWQASQVVSRSREHWQALNRMNAGSGLRYVGDLLGRVTRRAGSNGNAAQRRPGMDPDILAHNLAAQKGYRPRTWPGRITLVLRTEDRHRFSSDPSQEWGAVASGGYEVHFLPWESGDLFHAGRVQVLADCLTSAITHSTSES